MSPDKKVLKLGMPKGSLQESTTELFKKAGIRISAGDRSYFPYCDDCTQRVETCPNCAGELVPRPRRTTGATAIATRLPARLARNVGRLLGR
jgi:hypothetical protein